MNDRPAPEDEYPALSNGEAMESRVRRLESAVAAIQDTKLMEERLMERVMDRLPPPAPPPPLATPVPPPTAVPVPPDMLIEAGRAMLPTAISTVGAMTDPRNAPASGVLAPRSWLLTDLIQEFRTLWVLVRDHRFKPSWTIKTVPVICLTIFVVGLLTLGSFLGTIVQYFLTIFLVIVTYKTISREVERYRQETQSSPPRK